MELQTVSDSQKDPEPKLEMTTVFDSQEGCVYRIPALCYISDTKTLFAFAEKRKTSKDSDAEMLVMKTGKRKGDSNEIQWSDLKKVEKAQLCCHRTMNPCPVYDKNSKKLFLFFICVKNGYEEQWQKDHNCNKARLCYITTTDDGKTWSALTDLTGKLHEIGDWATFAVGPGHGIQMQSGRLIVPVYAYKKKEKETCGCFWCFCPMFRVNPNTNTNSCPSFALALYTDDRDKKWQFGKMLQTESVECQMAEFLDEKGNHVYCNARSKKLRDSDSGHRVEAVSQNEGVDFSNLTCSNEHEKLVETGKDGCQGSVVSFPAIDAVTGAELNSNNTWLLFTHTSDVNERNDLGVYLNKSPQHPDKWSKRWIIKKGASGYSDLAYIGEGLFVCLLEHGKEEKHWTKETIYQISSVMFSYKQVKPGMGQ